MQYSQVSQIIKKHLPILQGDPILSEVLKDGVSIVSKKAPSLADFLSPSLAVASNDTKHTWLMHRGCFKCASSRCTVCKYIDVSSTFESMATGQMYAIKQFVNCNTSYVVYLITCTLCSVQYVGSTVCKFRTRARRHLPDA